MLQELSASQHPRLGPGSTSKRRFVKLHSASLCCGHHVNISFRTVGLPVTWGLSCFPLLLLEPLLLAPLRLILGVSFDLPAYPSTRTPRVAVRALRQGIATSSQKNTWLSWSRASVKRTHASFGPIHCHQPGTCQNRCPASASGLQRCTCGSERHA